MRSVWVFYNVKQLMWSLISAPLQNSSETLIKSSNDSTDAGGKTKWPLQRMKVAAIEKQPVFSFCLFLSSCSLQQQNVLFYSLIFWKDGCNIIRSVFIVICICLWSAKSNSILSKRRALIMLLDQWWFIHKETRKQPGTPPMKARWPQTMVVNKAACTERCRTSFNSAAHCLHCEFHLSWMWVGVCQTTTINKLLTDPSDSSVYVLRDCGMSRSICRVKTSGGRGPRCLEVWRGPSCKLSLQLTDFFMSVWLFAGRQWTTRQFLRFYSFTSTW